MLLEALAIVEEIGSKGIGASVLQVSAGLAAFFEEWPQAAQLYGAANAQCEQIGYKREPATTGRAWPKEVRGPPHRQKRNRNGSIMLAFGI
jgi:hypothetical protein